MKLNFSDFKNWLRQHHISESRANTYVHQLRSIQKNAPQIFEINKIDNLISFFALYTEYSNRGYLLDRVTIGSAISYFREIMPVLNPLRWKGNVTVNISIYYKGQNYFIESINLNDVVDWLSLYTQILSKDSPFKASNHYSFDSFKFYVQIEKFKQTVGLDSLKNVGIHIEYQNTGFLKKKVAIEQYLNYACMEMNTSIQTVKKNPIITTIVRKNPGHWKPRYIIKIELTGLTALQIAPNQLNEAIYMQEDCLLTVPDLAKIFNVSIPTIKKMIQKFSYNDGFYWEETSVRRYYSIEATNKLLIKGHFHKRSYPRVNYNQKGYKKWCNRKQALQILGIGKTSFYKIRSAIKTYLSYSEDKNYRFYYKSEVKYLKNSQLISEIKSRNLKYN